jgi:hypothetical protein
MERIHLMPIKSDWPLMGDKGESSNFIGGPWPSVIERIDGHATTANKKIYFRRKCL